MAWLMSEARVLASIDVADSRSKMAKGLLGRDGIDGAYAIPHCRWIHTMGMRFDLDVAYVDASDTVIKIERIRRHRIGLPVAKAKLVIEAQAGAFERWGLRVGDPIELRLTDEHPDAHRDAHPHRHLHRHSDQHSDQHPNQHSDQHSDQHPDQGT